MQPKRVAAGAFALALTVSVPLATALPAQAAPDDPEVLASGLAGPLTLALGPGSSATYVTQSFAGELTRLDSRGRASTLVSDPNPDGELIGVSTSNQAVYYVDTDYGGPMPTSVIVRVDRSGGSTVVSDDLWEHEVMNNPDGGIEYGLVGLTEECTQLLEASLGPDSPPFLPYDGIIESHAYQTDHHDGTIYVADAAANAILAVDEASGEVSTVAVLPATPIDFPADVAAMFELPECVVGTSYLPEPVPTDVQMGKDGMLYVSTLGGGAGEMFPLSKVYRVDPGTGAVTEVAAGFFGATGLAVAPSGDIYVAEMFGGQVSRLSKGTVSVLFEADSPGDVEVRGSTVYATTGVFGDGAVVRMTAPRR